MLKDILQKRIVNTHGYISSDTGKFVHAYLRTHPKNKGLAKKLTKSIIDT